MTTAASPSDLDRVLERRFVIIAGKGGVGKTTVSAALALIAARRGKRVLVVELGSQERVAGMLGHPTPVGYEPTRVQPGIDVINVTPGPALHEYGLMKLRFEKVYRLVFDNPIMRSLTRMLPGMNELVMLGKAWFLEQERDELGKPRWDCLIVDAPATGHGISLLDLPNVVTETVKSGPLADEVGKMKALLVDPVRTCMSIVTLAEEMPVRETLDLRAKMKSTLGIAPGLLFVNGLYPELPGRGVEAAVDRLASSSVEAAGAARSAAFLIERRHVQEEHLAALQEKNDLPMISIPYVFSPTFGREAISRVALAIEAGSSPAPVAR